MKGRAHTHRGVDMWGSAIYGFFLGVGAVLFLQAAPQPAGSILCWGFLAGQLTWSATVCWRRTRLPFATAAMAVAGVTSALLAVLAAVGSVFPDLPPMWLAPVGGGLLASPLLLVIESRVHRTRWAQWKEHMHRKTAWEIFTGRHIPDLRGSA